MSGITHILGRLEQGDAKAAADLLPLVYDELRRYQLAWYLATSPIPAIRDGRSAVAFADKAVAATGRTNHSYLDILAAAFAEAGNFVKAVSLEREAIALSPADHGYILRLKLYPSNTPLREPLRTSNAAVWEHFYERGHADS